MVSNWR